MTPFTVADRYDVLAPLGLGGMGTVYLAKDRKFDVEVALKVASASGMAYEEFKQRFLREARISYALGQGEGIVRVLDWGVLDPGVTLYLVMDLVPGATSLDLAGLPLEARLRSLSRLARTVGRVHERGIVHRDLKPANVLVSKAGTLHLVDFGVAKVLDPAAGISEPAGQRGTQTGANLGTPQYMAPEQFKDSRDVDPRSDVYSLGVMLFYALCGRHPYEGDSLLEVMSAQLEVRYGRADPPRASLLAPGVPEELDRLCFDAIQLDPSARPVDGHAFAERLERAVAARPAGAADSPSPRAQLRLDPNGFASKASLQRALSALGEPAFRDLLAGTLALWVRHERPLRGKADLQGKFSFLLPRRARADAVTLGRTEENDICLPMPTISKRQLVFSLGVEGWTVEEQGSRNGTLQGQTPLAAKRPSALRVGDVLHLSKHFELELLSPQALTERLRANP